jgi:hypothetical protein
MIYRDDKDSGNFYLNKFRHYFFQFGSRYHTRLSPLDLAVLKKDQRWNALYPEMLSHFLVAVYINLDNCHLITKRVFSFFKYRGHHFTGPAPVGIKINKYRFAGIDNFLKTSHDHDLGEFKGLKD